MNDQQKNKAVAKIFGWVEINEFSDGSLWGFHEKYGGRLAMDREIPDYLSDLDALREAIHSLPPDTLRWYRNNLIQLTGNFDAIDATADQRVDALLSVHNVKDQP